MVLLDDPTGTWFPPFPLFCGFVPSRSATLPSHRRRGPKKSKYVFSFWLKKLVLRVRSVVPSLLVVVAHPVPEEDRSVRPVTTVVTVVVSPDGGP